MLERWSGTNEFGTRILEFQYSSANIYVIYLTIKLNGLKCTYFDYIMSDHIKVFSELHHTKGSVYFCLNHSTSILT